MNNGQVVRKGTIIDTPLRFLCRRSTDVSLGGKATVHFSLITILLCFVFYNSSIELEYDKLILLLLFKLWC